jgi:nicotinate-nucleotide adenylyltransferase
MARLGIFGGTFDPPHLGHLVLAAEACHQLDLDRLLWVLTPQPPHKQKNTITPVAHRLDMLSAAISDNTNFELCRVDIDRPGPHYAVDTVRILKEQRSGVEWIYLMGGDSLRDFHTWRKPLELLKMISVLGVMVRLGIEIDPVDLELKTPGLNAKVKYITTPQIGISASDIRQRVGNQHPYRYLVPALVWEIIQARGLYQIRQ